MSDLRGKNIDKRLYFHHQIACFRRHHEEILQGIVQKSRPKKRQGRRSCFFHRSGGNSDIRIETR
jgi:hypothetical protein